MMRCFSFLGSLVVLAAPLRAQAVQYEVSIVQGQFHVSADFPARGKDTLFVSLPAWSPGNYEIQNYARYLHDFSARGASGQPLRWDRGDKDTWRVWPAGGDRVTIEFDYEPEKIDLSLARTVADFAQFLGTNLFLFEAGQLSRPAEVRFRLPAGWQVTTALKGPTNGVYRASDYHELADAMTFLGRFSLDSLQAGGKWIRLAVWPATDYTAPVARSLRAAVSRMAPVQNRIMGEAPYDVYTIFFNVIHEPVDFGGGLEHSFSQYDIMPANAFADLVSGKLGDFMYPLMSHEFFHLWNVKRIRPVEMWPYNYETEQYTPLLWWSEGVTDYYADLTNIRSGLWSTNEFLANAGSDIGQIEATPEPWSVEDGSEATWINEVYINSSQLYYPKGSVIGFLMDITIRDATDNAHNLDEVMRALYTRYYKQGRGFSTTDLLSELRAAGMPDVDTFYRRYIDGREPLPYDSVFAKAGLRLRRETGPLLGVATQATAEGESQVTGVVPGSAAAAAGVQPNDILASVGDIRVTSDATWAQSFRARYRGKAGQPLTLGVRRGGQTLTLTTTVREGPIGAGVLERVSNPTAKQAKIWQGLATGL
jgi:predicted metalloprotease with PDZ domain